MNSHSNILGACFDASNVIAKHGKPFNNGEYIKEAWLKYASISIQSLFVTLLQIISKENDQLTKAITIIPKTTTKEIHIYNAVVNAKKVNNFCQNCFYHN